LKGSIGEGPNHSNHFEPFEPFEFFQNRNFPEFFLRKFKNFRKFQHFLTYRRNSDKISSKSEQKSVKVLTQYLDSEHYSRRDAGWAAGGESSRFAAAAQWPASCDVEL